MAAIDAVIFDWGGTLSIYADIDMEDMWRLAARHLAPDREDEVCAALVALEARSWARVRTDQQSTRLPELLEEVQKAMYQRALKFREQNTRTTESYEEFKEIIAEKRGFVRVKWAGDSDAEKAIKEETKATLRVIPFDQPEGGVQGKCIYTGRPATCEAIFARAY